MNLIDLAILGILALCVLIGYYRGFMNTLLTLLGSALTALIAWIGYPGLAAAMKAKDKLIPAILNYSESADMIGSIETYRLSVSTLDPAGLEELVEPLSLPHPLAELFTKNLIGQPYSPLGIDWFGDYLSWTITEMALHIGAFLLIFLPVFVVMVLLVRMVDYTLHFPALKVGDGLSGAMMGFLLGAMLLFVLFTALPVVLAFVPFDQLRLMTDSSRFCQLFYKANPFLNGLRAFIQ